MHRIAMNKLVAAALILGIAAPPALAQDKAKNQEMATEMKAASQDVAAHPVMMQLVGEITEVDSANHRITIKGPRGRTAHLAVAPDIAGFDQLKPGMHVNVDYSVGMALALLKGSDGIRERVETTAASVAEKGGPPNPAARRRMTIIATVERVDHKKKVAVLKGPEGQFVDMWVSEPALLKDIKPGDRVVANIYESVALSMRPMAAPTKK